jgi:hypothetical protein
MSCTAADAYREEPTADVAHGRQSFRHGIHGIHIDGGSKISGGGEVSARVLRCHAAHISQSIGSGRPSFGR